MQRRRERKKDEREKPLLTKGKTHKVVRFLISLLFTYRQRERKRPLKRFACRNPAYDRRRAHPMSCLAVTFTIAWHSCTDGVLDGSCLEFQTGLETWTTAASFIHCACLLHPKSRNQEKKDRPSEIWYPSKARRD